MSTFARRSEVYGGFPPVRIDDRGARALGFAPRGVDEGLALTAAGIAVGIGAALIVTRVMSSLLFGVGPMDPMTYVAVSAVLAAVALVATYLPARRASRVDPVVALRTDV